jgi:limonene-1,2-epoxide hydrolase
MTRCGTSRSGSVDWATPRPQTHSIARCTAPVRRNSRGSWASTRPSCQDAPQGGRAGARPAHVRRSGARSSLIGAAPDHSPTNEPSGASRGLDRRPPQNLPRPPTRRHWDDRHGRTAIATNGAIVRAFVDAFQAKDPALLAPFLHRDVVFRNYGDPEIKQGTARRYVGWRVLQLRGRPVRDRPPGRRGRCRHRRTDSPSGLPDRPPAPIMNLAVYELSAGLVTAWRDYTNPVHARELLRG